MMNKDIAPPLAPSMICLVRSVIDSSLKVVSIVASRVSIDTKAAAKLTVFDAVYTGLSYFLCLTMFIIAIVNETNVYAAIAIVVIS